MEREEATVGWEFDCLDYSFSFEAWQSIYILAKIKDAYFKTFNSRLALKKKLLISSLKRIYVEL